MNAPLLTLDRLTTGYEQGRRPHIVGRSLTATLPAAAVTALIGTNGTGKSTLLRTVAGLQSPLGGDIRWLGRPLAAYERRTLARTVAVVLTTRPTAEGLTVEEVVALGRLPHTPFSGRLTATDRRHIDEAIAMSGIEALRRRRLVTLSDGECQRVMLAKAWAQQTPAILLDEPTAHLDFVAKVEVMQRLRRLAREEGKGILLSTHDVELALHTADRLWLLTAEGLTEGTPQCLAADGTLARSFDSDLLHFDAATGRFHYS
jgi:iron complex transport system ATP-binding protein